MSSDPDPPPADVSPEWIEEQLRRFDLDPVFDPSLKADPHYRAAFPAAQWLIEVFQREGFTGLPSDSIQFTWAAMLSAGIPPWRAAQDLLADWRKGPLPIDEPARKSSVPRHLLDEAISLLGITLPLTPEKLRRMQQYFDANMKAKPIPGKRRPPAD